MIEFIKKYSSVPHDFIDDFFGIDEQTNDSEDDCIISLSTVAKWLEEKESKLMKILNKNFTRDKDEEPMFEDEPMDEDLMYFKTIEINGTEKTLITPDCFKELCMIIKTPKAKAISDFYTSSEKFIMEYHHDQQEKLRVEKAKEKIETK